jgi:iron complex outermembrane receptor protein
LIKARRPLGGTAMAVGLGVLAPGLGWAAPKLDLPAQSLTKTLNQIARAEDAELAFDRALTDGRRAPRLAGTFEVHDALARALAGSGLVFSRNSDGVFLIRADLAVPADEGAVSELLVVGRRNLNTGIRRSRDDIQPYKIADAALLETSSAETLEAFLRTRMPVNTQAGAMVQAPSANAASTRSRIDLLGLGANQTLVLVDGRRLPSQPSAIGNGAGFVQGDLNGIPIEAIERVEILSAAAGAIYGPGATGGAVNVVLKRRVSGLEGTLSQGVTDQGDGAQTRLNLRLGGVSTDGRGELSLDVGLGRSQGLRVGQRPYGQAARTMAGATMSSILDIPVGAGVNVVSLTGPLTLKPSYGGAALGSTMTHFSATGFSAAQAVANAGSFDTQLADNAYGKGESLVTGVRTRSLILSGRREFGRAEAFFDYLYLDNQGRAASQGGLAVLGPIGSFSAINPFEQVVYVARPVDWDGTVRNRLLTKRANAGLILRLGRGWTSEFDYSHGLSTLRVQDTATGAQNAALFSLLVGGVSPSPFASQSEFMAAFEGYRLPGGYLLKLRDRLSDVNLRASGPLARLPGGDLTMTVLAEARVERAPGGAQWGYSTVTGLPQVQEGNWLDEKTRSLYAEWRAPIASLDARGPWRGLELQVSLRADRYSLTAPLSDEDNVNPAHLETVTVAHTILGKTVGLRARPWDGLMLRGSYADGYLPPTSDQVQSRIFHWTGGGLSGTSDPRRGGVTVGADGPLDIVLAGSAEMRAERARTVSFGVVLTPVDAPGLRVSLDYLRTDKSQEITDFASSNVQYFVDRESQYPGRVQRATLTAEDLANGDMAGAIIRVDTSALNVGRSIAESIDLDADYRRDLAGGVAGLRLAYVWQPSYRRRTDPEGAWLEYAGFHDGPVRHRAVASAEWSKGRLAVGVDTQYVGSYSVQIADPVSASDNPARIAEQDGDRVRSQAYVDLRLSYRLGPAQATQLRLAASNIFDARAPLDVAAAMGYSPYGDPRGRRLDLTVSRRF